jgi:uncharacterized membrane protein YeaQ/YmgE (transglycosylase-associated protein family)
MSIFAWIVVGLVAGWMAKMAVPGREPGGFLATTLIGMVGAVVGGWIWTTFLHKSGATGLDLGSIFVAFIGAVVVLGVYHAVTGRSRA